MMAEKFKTYEGRYFHEGTWWAVQIAARDNADAKARFEKLRNVQLSGEVVVVLPGSTPTVLVRLLTWLRSILDPAKE